MIFVIENHCLVRVSTGSVNSRLFTFLVNRKSERTFLFSDIKQLSFDLLSKKLDLEIRLLGVRLSNLTFVGDADNETAKGEKRKTVGRFFFAFPSAL